MLHDIHTSSHISEREPSLDILRGFAVVLMIAAHAIYFFHTDTNILLQIIARSANSVVFSIFLFVSSAATLYTHLTHTSRPQWVHYIKHAGVLYLGYLVVATLTTATSSGFHTPIELAEKLFPTFLFINVPSFSEFLIPFVFYALAFPILLSIYKKAIEEPIKGLSTVTILYFLGIQLYASPVPSQFQALKAIFVGEENFLRFPILSYLPILFLGFWWAKLLALHANEQVRDRKALQIAVGSCVILLGSWIISRIAPIALLDPMNRWPPSIGFLAIGSTVIFICILLISGIPKPRWSKLGWEILSYLGRDSFDVYLAHMTILSLYRAAHGPQFSNPLTVILLFVLLLTSSMIVASFNWLSSPSVFTLRPVALGTSRVSRFRKRYFLAALALLGVTLLSTNITGSRTTVGSMIRVSDIREKSEEPIIKTLLINRKWFLTTDKNQVVVRATTKRGANTSLQYRINGTSLTGPLELQNGEYQTTISITTVPPGQYELEIIDSSGIGLKKQSFTVSAPVYIAWTLDWEGWDVDDEALTQISQMSQRHGNVPITHFWNPRIYLPSVVPPDRADILTKWLQRRIAKKNDAIALHLHMHFDMLAEAGVSVKRDSPWGYRSAEGYDIPTTVYSATDLKKLVTWSKNQFERNNLPIPIGYRAGGWFADEMVLDTLQKSEFLYDSSARVRPTTGAFKATLWDIPPTALPFYPSSSNQNATGFDALPILEIPNNGGNSFEHAVSNLIATFSENYPGSFVDTPRVVTYVSHPQWYTREFPKIETVLNHINAYSYEEDAGPVQFVTTDTLYHVWEKKL